MNQAIQRIARTETYTFIGKPTEEVRKNLIADGFQYDSRSRQWYKSQEQSQIVDEAALLPQHSEVAQANAA